MLSSQEAFLLQDHDAPTSSVSSPMRLSFLQWVQEASCSLKQGHLDLAARLYTDAITIDPTNLVLYSNRSLVHLKMNQCNKALYDARKCKQLKFDWSKGHLREGEALKCLGRYADALVSFCTGMSFDLQNRLFLSLIHEILNNSPLTDQFTSVVDQLDQLKQFENSFIVASIIGQEFLKLCNYLPSVLTLEAALRIGTKNQRLKGSVLSALSSAHWSLGNIDQAIMYMQQDLAIAKSLADVCSKCRIYGNLSAAYFCKGSYKLALQYRRLQLAYVIQLKDHSSMISVVSHLGHVCSAIGDYYTALLSHKRCAMLAKQNSDRLTEAREIGNVGAAYLAGGNVSRALECYEEQLRISQSIGKRSEEARAYSNLGSACHFQHHFERAVMYHEEVLKIAKEIGDQMLETRAYSGLGHAARNRCNYAEAKFCYEKQLDYALQTKDRLAEGRSCSNLGIVCHLLGEYEAALKLHKVHFQIAKDFGDRVSQGRACGNIGNAYCAMGHHRLAIRYHMQELAISREVDDNYAESSTYGNLAHAYQALGMKDLALQSYSKHLLMAQALKDRWIEAHAISNIGNYFSSLGLYDQALLYYEKFLKISEELGDTCGCGTACHGLGYINYCIGNFTEAVSYYNRNLLIAEGMKDKLRVCRAYCNLGLTLKALGDYDESLVCQTRFLETASEIKNISGKFFAMGNIGDLLLKLGKESEAVKMFTQQLQLSRQMHKRKLEAISLGNLGSCCRTTGQLDKALSYHIQELTMYQDLSSPKGECRAHCSIGHIHLILGNYANACRSYEEQLYRCRENGDVEGEAVAYSNMGVAKLNAGKYKVAIALFEQGLGLLVKLSGPRIQAERGQAYCNLADCYDAIGEHRKAICYYEKYLMMNPNSLHDQNCAYHGLGCAYQALGILRQALICFEKRLAISHELKDPIVTCSAYGELGCLHSLLGNFEQAVNYLEHQRMIAQDLKDSSIESEALCALGGVYHQMAAFERAFEHHQIDLELSVKTGNVVSQCRAYGNLGLCCESLGRYEEALRYQLKQLDIATEVEHSKMKTFAFTGLGRIYHAMGLYANAIESLQRGLSIACENGLREDEAKIRHRLGLSLWLQQNFEGARQQLQESVDLLEVMRRKTYYNEDHKASLFDLQTASYQVLQRVLVALNQLDEALVMAERTRIRASVDLLIGCPEPISANSNSWFLSVDSLSVTMDTILDTVDRRNCTVLYYSLAADYIHSWLVLPNKGIVKFHECLATDLMKVFIASAEEQNSSASTSDDDVSQRMEHNGDTKFHLTKSRTSAGHDECGFNLNHLGANQLNDVTDDNLEFLRMTINSHAWNCNNYRIVDYRSITRQKNSSGVYSPEISRSLSGAISVQSLLYDLLIYPMEDVLPQSTNSPGAKEELIIVLHGDLYLVPFSLLHPEQSAVCLYERYNFCTAPSIFAIRSGLAMYDRSSYDSEFCGAIVVGDSEIRPDIASARKGCPVAKTEQECHFVAEMLGCRSLTGTSATKDSVLSIVHNAEMIHFATDVSWKLSAIVLSRNYFDGLKAVDSAQDSLSILNYLLTAGDIAKMRIDAKLVVISSSRTDEQDGPMSARGVIGLTQAFLVAGVQSVLFPLWPVPASACHIFLKTLYKCLLNGAPVSQALCEAMNAVRTNPDFEHPSNWSCWTLVGNNVQISCKIVLMRRGLKTLLETPTESREAMRILLHLVEKTLQRLQNGQQNSMYMTLSSIENRVGEVKGWQDILVAMGFRFEAEADDIPAVVFFPSSDQGNRLTQCSANLQALLGLSSSSLICISKMKDCPEVGRALISLLQNFIFRMPHNGGNENLSIGIEIWKLSGIHEFLASLGFELAELGTDKVIVKFRQNESRRLIQNSIRALVAIFDIQDRPQVPLESFCSMENLVTANESFAPSSSNRENSSPPVSPCTAGKKSYFNPAEVDKLPSAVKNQMLSRRGCVPGSSGRPDLNLQLRHQKIIRNKYSSDISSNVNGCNPSSPKIISSKERTTEKNFQDNQNRLNGLSIKAPDHGQSLITSTGYSEYSEAYNKESFRAQLPAMRGAAAATEGKMLSGSGVGTGIPWLLSFDNRMAATNHCGKALVGRKEFSGELYDLNLAFSNMADSEIQTTPKQTGTNSQRKETALHAKPMMQDMNSDRNLSGDLTSVSASTAQMPVCCGFSLGSHRPTTATELSHLTGLEISKESKLERLNVTGYSKLDLSKFGSKYSFAKNQTKGCKNVNYLGKQPSSGLLGSHLCRDHEPCYSSSEHAFIENTALKLSNLPSHGRRTSFHLDKILDHSRSDSKYAKNEEAVFESTLVPPSTDNPDLLPVPLSGSNFLSHNNCFSKISGLKNIESDALSLVLSVDISDTADSRRAFPISTESIINNGTAICTTSQHLTSGTQHNQLDISSRVFPKVMANKLFPSQEDMAAPYVVNTPTVLKDALANIPPPLPGRYRQHYSLVQNHLITDARHCDLNSRKCLQRASALFFRNSSDRTTALSFGLRQTSKHVEQIPVNTQMTNSCSAISSNLSNHVMSKNTGNQFHYDKQLCRASMDNVQTVLPLGHSAVPIQVFESTKTAQISDMSRDSISTKQGSDNSIEEQHKSAFHQPSAASKQINTIPNAVLYAARF